MKSIDCRKANLMSLTDAEKQIKTNHRKWRETDRGYDIFVCIIAPVTMIIALTVTWWSIYSLIQIIK